LKYLLNLALEVHKVEGFFNVTADSLKLKKRLHGRAGSGKNNHGRFSQPCLGFDIIVAVGTELAKIGQTVFAVRDPDIDKHYVGVMLLGLFETFGTFVRRQNFIADHFETGFDNLTDIILVIYDQNAL